MIALQQTTHCTKRTNKTLPIAKGKVLNTSGLGYLF
jgi:hypothetical protein